MESLLKLFLIRALQLMRRGAEPQALPPNGADAILPTSCGNVHAARLRVAFM